MLLLNRNMDALFHWLNGCQLMTLSVAKYGCKYGFIAK